MEIRLRFLVACLACLIACLHVADRMNLLPLTSLLLIGPLMMHRTPTVRRPGKFKGKPVPDGAHGVLVVGAGPGGATCAYYLARQGQRVAMLEKDSFPRDKVL